MFHRRGQGIKRFIPTRFVKHSILEDGFAYYLSVESFVIILSIHQYRYVKLSYYDFPFFGPDVLKYLDNMHLLTWLALCQMIISVGLFMITAFMRKNMYSSLFSGILGLLLSINWLLHTALLSTDTFLIGRYNSNVVFPFLRHINSSMVIDGLMTSTFCLIFAIIQFNNYYLMRKLSETHAMVSRYEDDSGKK